MILPLNIIIISCIIAIIIGYLLIRFFDKNNDIEKYTNTKNTDNIDNNYNANIINVPYEQLNQVVDEKINSNVIDEKINSNVIDEKINSNVIDEKINSNPILYNKKIVTLYYADWCSHCHHVLPFFNELIDENKNNNTIVYKKMENKELEKHPEEMEKIYGFPTIIINYNNKDINYDGSRDKLSLLNYINGI